MRDPRNICLSHGKIYRWVKILKVWQKNIICSTVVVAIKYDVFMLLNRFIIVSRSTERAASVKLH